ncbi:hypothetical protein [Cryobacterium sp.]|uniref:hypothetical protein n=1 Tax=Cryobacterium sp. TaxID=1926290 RepID=UPI002624CDE7|nr:hypothetical protein [Cryobacterium sp.]MCU1447274.1 hypothetical protein [Cryobacterium sp.]
MFTLHIEHSVGNYDEWKHLFDADPLGRAAAGVTAFGVLRTDADPDTVWMDLDFDDRPEAARMKTALQDLWAGPASAMLRNPTVRLAETVESTSLRSPG